jgi:hypothetical protein
MVIVTTCCVLGDTLYAVRDVDDRQARRHISSQSAAVVTPARSLYCPAYHKALHSDARYCGSEAVQHAVVVYEVLRATPARNCDPHSNGTPARGAHCL